MKRTITTTLLLLLGVAFMAGMAMAQSPVVSGFTGGSNFGIFYGGSTGDVVGFRFTADANITLTHLGVQNDPDDGVLDSAHQVGLWENSGMTLLGSTSVDATGTLIDGFYYEPITPVTLTAGAQYTLGAMYTDSDNDSYTSSPTSVALDMISGTNGVFPSAGSLGFVYPANDSTNLARFGPNALYVPEPMGLTLLGCALLWASTCRRR